MPIKKRVIALFILLLSLIGLFFMQSNMIDLFQEFSGFIGLGVIGAIFANATGAGGGVIFVPVFNQFQLSTSEIIATSFAIQCFGMVAGSIAWRDQYLNAQGEGGVQASIWSVLPALLVITVPFSLLGIWTVQYSPLIEWVTQAEDTIHWLFGVFSILLALAILGSLSKLKSPISAQSVSQFDRIALAVIAYLGGMITAWLSVGVGELVAVYLILRNFSVTLSIACAVMLTAFSVWAGLVYYILINPIIVYPIAAFAGIGAVIGGTIAKHLVLKFSPYQVKVFFAVWVLLMGIANMPGFSL